MNRPFEKEILQTLLQKYQKRVDEGKAETNRRIFLKPSSVCRGYGGRTIDIQDKENFDYAVERCAENHFLFYRRKSGSSLIDEIWLNVNEVSRIEQYLQENYGIVPKESLLKQFQDEVQRSMNGPLTRSYGTELLKQSAHQIRKEEASLSLDVMKMLAFLEKNQEDLYIREASMLVYGTSKYFEEPQRMSAVCRAVRQVDSDDELEEEREDLVLEKYHVFNVEQEIRLKGKITLHFRNADIPVDQLADGIAVSSSDLRFLVSAEVTATRFLTIENKTSFERYHDPDTACMYLGGYASRHQIAFIRKVYHDNPSLDYAHFGDIDIGGLKIHQNLCRMTEVPFHLFHMGTEELNDPACQSCLQKLTENDLANAVSIEKDPAYEEIISVMKKKGKLEQEIISLRLMKQS